MGETWRPNVTSYTRTCLGLRRVDDFIPGATSVGKSLVRDSSSITCGMLRVSLCILIMATVLIIALRLNRILRRVRSSFYSFAKRIITWSNGQKRWET